MAGHSKWAQIKRAKGANDAKRGQLFSKLAKEITIAARIGNSDDPDLNPRLRMVLIKGKQANMPNDIVQRALKKAFAAESGNVQYEELSYEVYGPSGAAIYCEVQTDNRNRTAAEIRLILNRNSGQLATSGAVSRLFERKGQILIGAETIDEEKLMEIALNEGAEDFKSDEGVHEIITEPAKFEEVHAALEKENIKMELSQITFIPSMTTKIPEDQVETVQKLIDALDDNEDVKEVYTNAELP